MSESRALALETPPLQMPGGVVLARAAYMVRAVVTALVVLVVIAGGRKTGSTLDFAITVVVNVVLVGAYLFFFRWLRTLNPRSRATAIGFELLVLVVVVLEVVFLSGLHLLFALGSLMVLAALVLNHETSMAYAAVAAGYQPDRISILDRDSRTAPGAERTVLYSVRNLTKNFPIKGNAITGDGVVVQAVTDVSFDIYRGETLGLVGESGCGKTTMGRLLVRLLEPTRGTLSYEGFDLSNVWQAETKRFRSKMQIIFQDPYASLNPRLPVGDIIGEGLFNFGMRNSADRERIVKETLDRVGLRSYYINRYPHEFSGGQRQRIGIARALVLRPEFVVADEPVSALDVSIQSQVLNLLKDLQEEFGLTYVFISHNLAVVEHISDRVGVMYLGKLVELAEAKELYSNPRHPYTQALLSAVPIPDPTLRRERLLLRGDVPSPINPPSGCRFHTRCPLAQQICTDQEPAFTPTDGKVNHLAACHFSDTKAVEERAQKVAL